ncbi:MAG: porin family protein [Alphaproteobacteria bacterium]|nr:porin family protein [Alphaproteobacteria bacterium]
MWSGEPTVEDSRNPGGADGRLTLEPDYGYGGYVGYAFGNGLRIELEAAMREIDNDELRVGGFGSAAPVRSLNGDLTHYTGMVNAYWDPVRWWRFEPYIGAGLGVSFVGIDASDIKLDDDTTVFAYQAMAGLRTRVLDRLYFVAGYRYFSTSNLRLGGATLDYHAHTIDFGFARHF